MIKSAVTISLVPEARGGPFVFWDDLAGGVRKAAEIGFDAVEIFPSGPESIDRPALRKLLDDHKLSVAAVGTGAGWVKHKLHLCMEDRAHRDKAQAFIKSIIDIGGEFKAPAIIGSMQGRWGDVGKDRARSFLVEALTNLGEHARQYGVPLIYEPLNRYETNHCNTIEQGLELLSQLPTRNVVLLADLFHENIEEVDIAAALQRGGKHIGHLHFVDSNRRPAGCGHLDYAPIVTALKAIGYAGYASAEALPYPDSDQAAKTTIQAFRRLFVNN